MAVTVKTSVAGGGGGGAGGGGNTSTKYKLTIITTGKGTVTARPCGRNLCSRYPGNADGDACSRFALDRLVRSRFGHGPDDNGDDQPGYFGYGQLQVSRETQFPKRIIPGRRGIPTA